MLRIAGCFLTAAGCVGLGCWYRWQFQQRLAHIRILVSIMDMMMSEVRYSKATLPECCVRLADRLEEPYRSSFLMVQEEMARRTGEAFGELFERQMKRGLEQAPLGREEKELFLEFAGGCGYEDARMQLTSMEQYRERLQAICDSLAREVSQKGKMAVGLGTLGGLLLVIIFL